MDCYLDVTIEIMTVTLQITQIFQDLVRAEKTSKALVVERVCEIQNCLTFVSSGETTVGSKCAVRFPNHNIKEETRDGPRNRRHGKSSDR